MPAGGCPRPVLNAGLVFPHAQADEPTRPSDPRTAPPARQFPVIAELAAGLLHPPHQQRAGTADHRHQPTPQTAAGSPRGTFRSGPTRLASPGQSWPGRGRPSGKSVTSLHAGQRL